MEASSDLEMDHSRSRDHTIIAEASPNTSFETFSRLPAEIRNQIWAASLTPRIVKWVRTSDKNIFTAPTHSLPLLSVCRESREAALLYGQYQLMSSSLSTTPVWFSPLVDYLFFDPGWIQLNVSVNTHHPNIIFAGLGTGVVVPRVTNAIGDSLDTLPHPLLGTRKIMVHPNYTDERKRPSTSFEKLKDLKEVLVAADEKSIGVQSRFMSGTVYDIGKYFEEIKRRDGKAQRSPRVAVGCLGWVGDERRIMIHGAEDKRKLVAVFENDAQMKDHLNLLREEERRFTQERFQHSRPKLTLRLRTRRSDDIDPAFIIPEGIPKAQPSENTPSPPCDPPTYSESVHDTAFYYRVD